MDLASSVVAGLNALKASKDILSTVLGAKIDADVREKVADVVDKFGAAQDAMYDLREELFKLQSENQELKGRIAAADDWNNQLAKYKLTKTTGGAVVYCSIGEPTHFICPSCVNQRQLQILQDNRTVSGKYRCVGCKAEFPIEPREGQQPINYPPAGMV